MKQGYAFKKPEKYFDKLVTLWLSTANHFLECYSKVAVTSDVQEQGQIIYIATFGARLCNLLGKGWLYPTFVKTNYSSPSQLRYPQLSYFHSNATLNWVPKNSS